MVSSAEARHEMEPQHTQIVKALPDPPSRGQTLLLANGASGCWDIDVDESPDGNEWTLQLVGPQAYLVFRLRDLGIIPKAVRFLQAGPNAGRNQRGAAGPDDNGELPLGRFGSASVSLRWDDEEGFRRCFLIIGQTAHSTMHLNLYDADIDMIVEALRQVVDDLPNTDGE